MENQSNSDKIIPNASSYSIQEFQSSSIDTLARNWIVDYTRSCDTDRDIKAINEPQCIGNRYMSGDLHAPVMSLSKYSPIPVVYIIFLHKYTKLCNVAKLSRFSCESLVYLWILNCS